jgi:hypothetical protein
MVLNDHDFSTILKTVINIAIVMLRNEPLASFGFVGVHKDNKETKETPSTQRFRIYSELATRFLGGETFLHSYESKVNCYILINRSNENPEKLLKEIIDITIVRLKF